MRKAARVGPLAVSIALFGLNALICAPLFATEYLSRMDSIEGAFIALARYMQQNWRDLSWFPLWFSGMPFQNTYPPLVHAITAAVATLPGWSPALAYHAVTALFYSLGPVALFWALWKWSLRMGTSLLAALLYSLVSPSAWLLPEIRADVGGPWFARRLQNLVVYGEGPHICSLTLIPLAVLGLEIALKRGRTGHYLWTLAALIAVVLMNWPGAIGLTLAVAAWIACQPARDLLRATVIVLGLAVTGYLIVSPWCPPSTVKVILFNAQRAGGDYVFGYRHLIWLALAAGVLALLRLAALRLNMAGPARFALLLAILSAIIVVAASQGLPLLPQPMRFHLEFEMAACILGAFGLAALARYWRYSWPVAVVLGGIQLWNYTHYARQIIRPLDIRRTVEYQEAMWLDRHVPQSRVFTPGSVSFWMNIFTDTPQLAGCCDQSAPNWENRVAAYTIYTDENAGDKAAYYSLVWLKAFGVRAIGTGGPGSREHYHPYRHPAKFDGMLKEIWRDGDDVLLEVPHRSPGLAHVIREEHLVRRAPVHGLDVAPVLPYIAGLEDPALPVASLHWKNRHTAWISARLRKDDLISVQVSYTAGWHAAVDGRPRQVFGDGIGLIAVRPQCQGDCTVELWYDGGREMTTARWASGLTLAGVLLAAAFSARLRGSAG